MVWVIIITLAIPSADRGVSCGHDPLVGQVVKANASMLAAPVVTYLKGTFDKTEIPLYGKITD